MLTLLFKITLFAADPAPSYKTLDQYNTTVSSSSSIFSYFSNIPTKMSTFVSSIGAKKTLKRAAFTAAVSTALMTGSFDEEESLNPDMPKCATGLLALTTGQPAIQLAGASLLTYCFSGVKASHINETFLTTVGWNTGKV